MTDKIYKTSYDQILFFDIETVRGENVFTPEHPQYPLWAWTQRNKETNVVPKEKKLLLSYNRKAALFPEFAKIVCISVGYIKDDKIVVKALVGDEKEILKQFVKLVTESGRKLCGHNVILFDLPFIRKRFFINGLTDYLTKSQGNDGGCKSWHLEDNVLDTMQLWQGTGFMNTGLEVLASCFGIQAKEHLHGHQTSDYFYAGKIQELIDYCNSDVWATANILRRWKNDNILPLVVKEEAVKPLPLLERLLASKRLTQEDVDKIKALQLSDEEKVKAKELVTICLGITSRKKMDKQVLELFNSL